MELAPRHKFLRAVASSDILKQVFSTTADAMLFRLNTRKTGNNTVEKTVEMSQAHLFERFKDLNQFKGVQCQSKLGNSLEVSHGHATGFCRTVSFKSENQS